MLSQAARKEPLRADEVLADQVPHEDVRALAATPGLSARTRAALALSPALSESERRELITEGLRESDGDIWPVHRVAFWDALNDGTRSVRRGWRITSERRAAARLARESLRAWSLESASGAVVEHLIAPERHAVPGLIVGSVIAAVFVAFMATFGCELLGLTFGS